ncbi:hypothetical protein LZ009_08585 [Ramlibacter sp. XY19]|uniref:hypothetical protein n=1 Tax=Ramlibacter paludis TaxID=2908000 RepID=UPI0023D9C466|nr:hypothetical protein [Ramlibacter paludis]MCG2592835.1 hypothetical protein [Ramlibacter paludis]
MTQHLRFLQGAIGPLLLSLLAACGGGASDPPRTEEFAVAPVMRQLAAGFSFSASITDPQTGSVTHRTTVTYAAKGPGAFERQQTFTSAQSRDPSLWSSTFVDSAAGGGLRFTAFNGGGTPGPLANVHELPAKAVPDLAEVFPGKPEQLLFTTDSFLGSASIDQWAYQWNLVRKSDVRAELCLATQRINQGIKAQVYTDCFEIDGSGTILKTRTVFQAQCCRLPEIVEKYE